MQNLWNYMPAICPGARVAVPEYLYRPQVYDESGEFHAFLGTVHECGGNLVAVKFDLYPHIVDYTWKEADQMLTIAESEKSPPAPNAP